MPVVTVTINDELVSANSDQSLLLAMQEHGVEVPTLCHMEFLSERGACRLCVVEVKGNPRLMPACSTQVQEGMVVYTHTERLVNYRRMIMELLLSERNHVCAVCVTNGNCELQDQAAALGVDQVRYDYIRPLMTVDASHERFVLDHNRCILCYRCVRVCDEIEGAHSWDMTDRGINTRVIVDLNQPWGTSESCTSCGKCVQVCPTGALSRKGATVGEMVKHHEFLPWITAGRLKREWSR